MKLFLVFLLSLIQACAPAYAGTQAIVKADIIEGVLSPKNYIGSKGHFEKSINGWSGYDSGSADPGDCTTAGFDGSISRSTLSPLSGDGQLAWAKSGGVSRLGNGIKADFTIDEKDRGSVLSINFDYKPDSLFSDDQLIVYVYDVTNAKAIAVTPQKVMHSLVASQSEPLEFQTSIDSSSYRLCIHTVGTSTANWTVNWDNFSISKDVGNSGPFVSDWIDYTPVWTTSGTAPSLGNGTVVGRWRRVGDTVEIEARLNLGSTSTVGTGENRLSGPSGISLTQLGALVGGSCHFYDNDSSANNRVGSPQLSSGLLTCYLNSTGQFQATTTGWGGAAGNDAYTQTVKYKVTGWSSNMALSSDNPNIPAYYYSYGQTATGTITTNPSIAILGSVNGDNLGGYNTSNGTYTIKVPGTYFFSGKCNISGTNSGTNYVATSFFINGSSRFENFNRSGTSTDTVASSGSHYFNAGDTLALGCRSDMTSPIYNNGLGGTWLTIANSSGRVQIAASDTSKARYTTSSGQSIPSATLTTVNFNTKVTDSLGSVTTGASWIHTSQGTGTFKVAAQVTFSSSVYAVGNQVYLEIWKNGSFYSRGKIETATMTTSYVISPTIVDDVECITGDTITIRVQNNRASATTLTTTAAENFVSITRTGL